jgi:hypothetical protein
MSIGLFTLPRHNIPKAFSNQRVFARKSANLVPNQAEERPMAIKD